MIVQKNFAKKIFKNSIRYTHINLKIILLDQNNYVVILKDIHNCFVGQ